METPVATEEILEDSDKMLEATSEVATDDKSDSVTCVMTGVSEVTGITTDEAGGGVGKTLLPGAAAHWVTVTVTVEAAAHSPASTSQ